MDDLSWAWKGVACLLHLCLLEKRTCCGIICLRANIRSFLRVSRHMQSPVRPWLRTCTLTFTHIPLAKTNSIAKPNFPGMENKPASSRRHRRVIRQNVRPQEGGKSWEQYWGPSQKCNALIQSGVFSAWSKPNTYFASEYWALSSFVQILKCVTVFLYYLGHFKILFGNHYINNHTNRVKMITASHQLLHTSE